MMNETEVATLRALWEKWGTADVLIILAKFEFDCENECNRNKAARYAAIARRRADELCRCHAAVARVQ